MSLFKDLLLLRGWNAHLLCGRATKNPNSISTDYYSVCLPYFTRLLPPTFRVIMISRFFVTCYSNQRRNGGSDFDSPFHNFITLTKITQKVRLGFQLFVPASAWLALGWRMMLYNVICLRRKGFHSDFVHRSVIIAAAASSSWSSSLLLIQKLQPASRASSLSPPSPHHCHCFPQTP